MLIVIYPPLGSTNCFIIINMALKHEILSSTWWPTSSKEKRTAWDQNGRLHKRHKSERSNANPALYPTGFTCYAFSKGPPVKAHRVRNISHSALSQGLKQLSKGPLCHSNSEEYRNPGNSYSINIYWGLPSRAWGERDKERTGDTWGLVFYGQTSVQVPGFPSSLVQVTK